MTAPRASFVQWQLEQYQRAGRLSAWCAVCEIHQVTAEGQACPVCEDDEKRQAS